MTLTVEDGNQQIAGGTIHYQHGGSGPPLWIVHRDTGNPGWLPFYELLAQRWSVVVPDLPGYGTSERDEWMRSVRDEAIVFGILLARLAQEPVTIVGLGFGGWVAAELATMQPSRLRRLVLVSPMGLLPREGEIFDQFLVSHKDYVLQGFHDRGHARDLWGETPSGDQLVAWDVAREMTTRIAWRPYMYSQQLELLLREVRVPSLVVWGQQDTIVPPVCGRQYVEALPDARLELVEQAGHYVEVEQPEQLACLVGAFTAPEQTAAGRVS